MSMIRRLMAVVVAVVVAGCPDPEGGGSSGTSTDGTDTGGDPTDSAADSDTGPAEGCGNDIIEAGEECDGINLGGASCETLGFGGGALACAPGCVYDPEGCVFAPGVPVLSLSVSAIKHFDFSWETVDDAAYYLLEQSTAPGEPFVPLGEQLLGTSVSYVMPLHLRYGASYRLRACNAWVCSSSSDAVEVVDSMVEAIGYIKASNADAFDRFGYPVVMSTDGDTFAVGAWQEDSSATGVDGDQRDDSLEEAGAVYVFGRDEAGTWSQQAYLKAFNPDANDYFGGSVTLSADGSTLAVGANGESSGSAGIGGDPSDDSLPAAGAVYVFTRDDTGTWSQQAYIKSSSPDSLDAFGFGVALNAAGDVLAVGAQGEASGAAGIDGDEADDSLAGAGAVYVFTRDGMDTWSQQAYIKASNPDAYDRFGTRVALNASGDTLAVGAQGESGSAPGINGDQSNDSFPNAGAVYVFARDGMDTWSQQAYIKSASPDVGDDFGGAVALSDDGSTLAVGAQSEASGAIGIDGDPHDDSTVSAGAAYVYTRDGMGTWSQQAYVKASNPDSSDDFGISVALSANGNTLVVGAQGEASGDSGIGGNQNYDDQYRAGAVYVFVRDDTNTWSQRSYVKAPNPDTQDRFGYTVSLSGSADTLLVGAPFEAGGSTGIGGDQEDDRSYSSGAVYLY